MASLGHVAVGLLAGRIYAGPEKAAVPRAMATFVVISLLPDIDVALVAMGIDDTGLSGHRGLSHTLCFAVVGALVAAWLGRQSRAGPSLTAVMVFLTLSSHGVLDAATTDGRGILLLWPFSDTRIAAPVRPIPDAPTGLGFFSARGLEVAVVETVAFLPATLLAICPHRYLRPALASPGPGAKTAAFLFGLALSLISARLWLEWSPLVARVWGPAHDQQAAIQPSFGADQTRP